MGTEIERVALPPAAIQRAVSLAEVRAAMMAAHDRLMACDDVAELAHGADALRALAGDMTTMRRDAEHKAGGLMLADGKRPRDQAIPTTPGHIAGGPGDGSGIDDQVPATIVNPQTGAQMGDARLSTDEYVIPADVVRAKGVEFFDKLLQKYHTPAAQQRAQAIPA